MKGNYPPNCVIALNKIAVWLDMAGDITFNATGAKDISLKSKSAKKCESVSV